MNKQEVIHEEIKSVFWGFLNVPTIVFHLAIAFIAIAFIISVTCL